MGSSEQGPSRRAVLAAIAGAAGLASAAGADEAGTTARGVVYEDLSGSWRRTGAERGLPDVMVSNGRDVTRTDAGGRWSLPVREGDAIFVIKPTGWATPVDPVTHLPRFSYIHQPDGTPERLGLRYRGIAPTGPLPASIDFPLRPQQEPTRFDVLLLTDPQPEDAAELTYVRDDVLARAAAFPAAFGVTLGDVMFDDLSLYARSNRLVSTIGVPWYNVCGNHDMNYEAPDNTHSRETFKREFGARSYAWQYGGVTFLALDNVEYLGNHKYRGRFGPEQIGFVRSLLAELPRDQLVVVCMHVPLCTAVGAEPNTAAVDARGLLQALGDRPHCVSYSGHTHTNEHHYLGEADGAAAEHHHHVLSAASGSWWSGPFDARGIPVAVAADGTPNGFHVLSIEGNTCQTRLVPAHDASPGMMRIVLDRTYHREDTRDERMGVTLGGTLPQSGLYGAFLVVNLFDGGPRSQLAFRVAPDGAWQGMQRAEQVDPYVQELYARNAETRKPWVQPQRSTHLWRARLPADLAPGTYRVSVRAADEHGRAHEAEILLEILGA